jgi:formylglycine-generating enzyme required for sulfatase activity
VSDIFLSYASPDRPRVKPLVDALQHQGWSVWWDRTILPGKIWDEVIEAALDDAQCVIVLWSRASIQSPWVRTEASEGKRRRILVPALIDDVNIPLEFRKIQAANLVDWSGVLPNAGFDGLARAVTEILSNAALFTLDATATTVMSLEAHNEDRTNAAKKAEGERVASEAKAKAHKKKRDRRRLVLIGGPALACIGGLVSYLATHRHASSKTEPNPRSEPVPIHVPDNPETKLVLNPKDGLAYVWIPPGRFTMGCSEGDSECELDEKPSHQVSVSKGFWMGQTEVTQEAYKKVTGKNPSRTKGANLPVESVNWDKAQAYCHAVGAGLPTEAEWEYAARGGNPLERSETLDAVAWYGGNSGSNVHEVGQKQVNKYGLYDVLGNVWEWVADWYDPSYYEKRENTDPKGPPNGKQHVLRGGSWFCDSRFVRVSVRSTSGPTSRYVGIGFRCAEELR